MKIIFIHPNFPAQFRHLAGFLARDKTNQVSFITANPRPEWKIPGVRKIVFEETPPPRELPDYLRQMHRIHDRGRAAAKALAELKKQGFTPDLIMGASGWGVTLFVKDLFPGVPFLGYFEWFYDAASPNARFGRKHPPGAAHRMEHRERSLSILSDLAVCDHGICPTHWQKAQFPKAFHPKLSVIHDGIDPDFFKPAPASLALPRLDLSGEKEIVTYTARGFEPYRGFPQFMESIPQILARRPRAHIVIVGEDRVCYGAKLPKGQTYKKKMLEKIDIDPARVHFLPSLPYGEYRQVLRASTVHIYLTVPFVLSWSLLEAMACGCLVVASDTEPVREVIQDGVNGMLTDFFDTEKLAEKVAACLEYPSFMAAVRQKARRTVEDRYSLDKILAAQTGLIQRMLTREPPPRKRRFG